MKNTILLIFIITALTTTKALSQTGVHVPQMTHCDTKLKSFLNFFQINGATIAISKDGKLIYERGFGNANTNEVTQPYHMFRIASLSKPITALAIMKMYENGKLNLDDKVFGQNGILSNHPQISNANFNDDRYYDITVKMLLQHTAGWNRSKNCFPNPTTPYNYWVRGCDPISAPLHVTQALGANNPVTEEDLIRFVIEKGLDFNPGTKYSYSNIGYLVLGEIIETLSGMSYEEYVQSAIFSPLNICDTKLGKNLFKNKFDREATYYSTYKTLSCYGTGETVPFQYGGWNLEAMSSHGGWVSTSRDLVKIMSAIDGNSNIKDILTQETINEMVSPSSANNNYACGWSVNSNNNWWHTGSLDGTASIMVKANNGYTWAFLLNKRVTNPPINVNLFYKLLDERPWECVNGITEIPNHDLFAKPKVAASDLNFSQITNGTATLSWNNGDGDFRIVVATNEEKMKSYPVDGTEYNANSQYGSGYKIGNAYVVYNGNDNNVNISGLEADQNYQFIVYEYNKNSVTGNHPLYNLCTENTSNISVSDINYSANNFAVYPNPANDFIKINTPKDNSKYKFKLMNISGKLLSQGKLSYSNNKITLDALPKSVYLLEIYQNGKLIKQSKIIKK